MSDKKVSWNDINTATQQELKSTYKLSDRQLEQAVRKHYDGANATERRKLYNDVYSRRK